MTIAQAPNPPLIAAVALMVIVIVVPAPYKQAVSIAADLAFAGWAIEEIHLGVNWFRRVLGAVVLIGIFISMVSRLG